MARAISKVRCSLIILCLTLAPFLGGAEANAAFTLKGTVVKGPVSGATVKLYLLRPNGDKGKLLGTKVTDGAGRFTLKLSAAPAVPVLVESAGGSYTDEVTGGTITLAATDLLTAIVPVGKSAANVTPLTHLAATRARALALAGARLPAAAASSSTGVAQQYELKNIGETIPVAADDPVAVLTAAREQRNYGLVLAGLSQEAHDMNVRTADLISALAADLSDGTLDGAANLAPIFVPTLGGSTVALGNAGTSGLQAAIDAFVASPRNRTALAEKNVDLDAVKVGINGAGLFYTTSTVLPAWFSGRPGSATLTAKGGTKPYRCSLAAGSTLPPGLALANNCVLSGTAETLAPDTPIKITPPFTVVMRDSAAPPASATLQLRVTIIAPGPTFKPVEGAHCYKGVPCSNARVANATGGTPPYYFTSSSFATGAPPLGTFVSLGGFLNGTASVTGTFKFGVTAVDLVGAMASGKATVEIILPPKYTLRVTKSGNGTGTVTSSPAGIACGSDCANGYVLGKVVTLSAAPNAGQAFTGWSGDCDGTSDCVLTMDDDRVVNAQFKTCAANGKSCDSAPCCTGTCAPNPGCPGFDLSATNTCYGPCGGSYPYDCGNKCCGIGFPVCGAGCWCWEY